MGLNDTPSGERIHISFFGKRNAGKSSLVNAVTGQNLAIVSDVKGTTTDPVYKAMELLPLGPVMIVDTPGIDDEGTLGELRISKTKQVLNKTDIAVLVVDVAVGLTDIEKQLIELFQDKELDYIIAYNKIDLVDEKNLADKNNAVNYANSYEKKNTEQSANEFKSYDNREIFVSAKDKVNIYDFKEKLAALKHEDNERHIVGDLINQKDLIILVTPVDEAAPKGRLILPQQQTIRDILDNHAISIVVQEDEIKNVLANLAVKPKLVITDSQAFERVNKEVPSDILLTSFSILFARYKGLLDVAVDGVRAIDKLEDGDTVLISEGCTHHRQCNDIGTVKLPGWINKYTGKKLNYEYTSGGEFKENLSGYKLVVHCGGCMLNDKEMRYRQRCAVKQNIAFTNYGILIAYMHGILERSIEILKNVLTN